MSDLFKKVLITGCSFSANNTQSGWREENLHKTYHGILEEITDWKITNQAIGGCSNREIAQQTVESCLTGRYDLCIVQWSSLDRLWLYEADSNIDDFTQIVPRVTGKTTVGNAPHTINKLIVAHYMNHYMALKHWLHDQVMLQSFLKERCIPYIFLRGFDNFISELEMLAKQWPVDKISDLNIPPKIKHMLNFDSNPDDYLYKKLSSLILAYLSIDKCNCIGYNQSSKIYGLDPTFARDYADDNEHPGYLTNTQLSKNILDHINKGITFESI
jgi:hypothetical protein